MSLHYLYQVTKSSGYGYHHVLKHFRYDEIGQRLKIDYNASTWDKRISGENLRAYISTKVGFRKWVLVLDCDTPENKDKAIEEIRSMDLKYDVMESSLQRFWIIVDYIETFKKSIELMKTIPGIDLEFVNHCAYNKKIVLRAFPKNGFIPRRDGSNRMIVGTNVPLNSQLTGWNFSLAMQWALEFRRYWNGGIVEWLTTQQRKEIEANKNLNEEAEKEVEEVEKKRQLEAELKRAKKRRVEVSWNE